MGKVFDEKAEKTNLEFDSSKLFAGYFFVWFSFKKNICFFK